MPYRYFRRVRLAPRLTVNLSKRGASLSLGTRGMHYIVGHGRRRTTVGIPGTGMYWTTYSHRHAAAATRGRAPTPARGASTAIAATSGTSLIDLFHKPPLQKIGWGLLYTVLVITAPIGLPLLLTGLVQLPMPTWRQRALIHRALAPHRRPTESTQLLDQAARIAGETPEVVAARAELAYRNQDWAAAARLYDQYLYAAPGDWLARSHYAHACLNAGWYDNAITGLQQVLSGPIVLDEDSRAEIAYSLANGFLGKDDVAQALAILKEQPLQRHQLSAQLAACLYLRGVCEYLSGQRARGLDDLDRLYAIAPDRLGELQQEKAAMQAGTFAFELPDGRRLTSVPTSNPRGPGPG